MYVLDTEVGKLADVPVATKYFSPHAPGLPAEEKSAVYGHVVVLLQLKKQCTLQRQSASMPSAVGSLVKTTPCEADTDWI